MNNNTTISQQAHELYSKMKSKGAMYETDMVQLVYPKPIYPTDKNEQMQRDYWQWDVNLYGGEFKRPVGNGVELFKCPTENSNYSKVRELFMELKNIGLAHSRNAGYSEFVYWVE